MDDGYRLRSDTSGFLNPVLQEPRKWGLYRRFGIVLLPLCALCLILMSYGAYQVMGPHLTRLLSGINLIEARVRARSLEELLQSVAVELLHTAGESDSAVINADNSQARQPAPTPQDLKRALWRLNFIRPDLVVEAAYKSRTGEAFALVRSNGKITQISATRLREMQFSPLDSATLTDAIFKDAPDMVRFIGTMRVNYSEQNLDNKDAPELYVMRLALPVYRGEGESREAVGVLVFGINLLALRDSMLSHFGADSPTRLSWQEDELSLEYFFDLGGWILFQGESTASPGCPLSTDIVRMGMNGDFGRIGLDSAFRPDVSHVRFWKMLIDVRKGVHGETSAVPGRYSFSHSLYDGYLCYAPVYLRAGPGQEPVVIGGVASIESSTLSRVVKSELFSSSSYLLAICLLLFSVALYPLCRVLANNLTGQRKQIKDLLEHGRLHNAKLPFFSKEPALLQTYVQQLCGKYFLQGQELVRLDNRLKSLLSRQRVSLPKLVPHRSPLEIKENSRPAEQADSELLGQSKAVMELRDKIRRAAGGTADVLVWGETGTGKELTAIAIHKLSSRAAGPFLSINCGALDENLLLDALFGHVKGAFSEAKSDRKGAFAAASGGTLLLDEIGTASARVQQAMLRALSTRSLRPLGSDKEIYFDTRIVAATNVDLRECVKNGSFREDLYYRLAVITIETPTLRQRKDDIPLLAEYFLSRSAAKLGHLPASLSQGALDAITDYSWPGNVRELKNCLTQALTFVEGDLIFAEHLRLGQTVMAETAEHDRAEGDGAWHEFNECLQDLGTLDPPEADETYAGKPRAAARDKSGESGPHQPGRSSESSAIPLSALGPSSSNSSAFRGAGTQTGAAGMPRQAVSAHDAKITPAPGASGFTVAGPAPGALAATRQPGVDDDNSRLERLLNERQIKVWPLILSSRSISRSEYQSFLEAEFGVGLPLRTAQYDLQDFVRKGVLLRVGGGPSTRYMVSKDLKNIPSGK